MLVSLLPLLAALATASPVMQEAMQIKHSLPSAPAGWQLKSQANPDAKMHLHIGMKEQNLDQLQKRLLETSNPDHADYGKHMSRDEIERLTKPTEETQNRVKAWLASHGIAAEAPVNNGFIQVKVTAAQANKLLAADYGLYHNAAEGRSSLRTTSYSVPVSMHEHITTIQPTTMFASLGLSPQTHGIQNVADVAPATFQKRAACTSSVTPACLKDSYNIHYSPTSASSLFGVTGFLGQVASQSDLNTFIKSYGDGIPAGKGNFSVELINGGSNSGSAGIEADLDIEYTVGLTYPMKNVFLATGGEPPYDPSPDDPDNGNEPYLDLLNWLAGQDKIPQTITSSYADNELTVPPDYAQTVCDGFMKLGARGTTFIAGSGDGGVSGAQNSQCDTRDGGKAFVPTFPSTCPWITSVGGTSPGSSETAASLSTGGFSNYFPRPDYQSAVVQAYLKTLGTKYQGMYNASGRGFPDVAAFALNYKIAYQGRLSSVGGTSAATPVFASIVALLNDYLASQGKPSLGFLNPFLYSKGVQAFKDITSGNNPGCGTNGFSAVKGWDPITGLGSPNFGTLKSLV